MRRAMLALLLLGAIPAVKAHDSPWLELRLQQQAPGRYSWHWASRAADRAMLARLQVHWPQGCQAGPGVLVCSDGLHGRLEVQGLAQTAGVANVRLGGPAFEQRHVLTATQPGVWLEVPPAAGAAVGALDIDARVLLAYWQLGMVHIFTGWDHLMFVLGLAGLIGMGRALVLALTGFSVAHTLTLAASALGWLQVPPLPVEACIALSIALVCSEALKSRDTLARRAPFVLAFSFGLVHGLGFAGGLLEIGLPASRALAALLGFNLGVETGQLAVVALAWMAVRAARSAAWAAQARAGLLWSMGAVSAYWSVERLSAILAQEIYK